MTSAESSSRGVWRYGIAALALTALIWYVGPRELLAMLARTRPVPLVVYLTAYGLLPFMFGAQMYVALRISGYAVTQRATMRAAVSAWSVGTLTPARTGDLSLAYLMRPVVPETDMTAIVVADKLVSLLVLAGLALVSALFVTVPYGRALAIGAALVFGMALAITALLRTQRIDELLRRVVDRRLGTGTRDAWERLRTMILAPRFLLWCATASTMRWLYVCAINMIIFRAVDQSPGFWHVTAATTVGRIISLVPISVGGVGVKEPVQILIYDGAGVPAEAVLAVSVLGLVCGFVVAAVAPLMLPALRRPATGA